MTAQDLIAKLASRFPMDAQICLPDGKTLEKIEYRVTDGHKKIIMLFPKA